MSYDVIFFDADDTLYDYAQSEAYALAESFREAKLEVSEQLTGSYRTINQQLWREYEQGAIDLALLRSERFARLIADNGLTIPWTAEEFSHAYLRYLGEGSFLIEGAVEICRELLTGGHRLAVITNGIREVQLSRIGRSELADAFEHIIVSEDAGIQKPNPAIFDFAFAKLNLTGSRNALIVGDSLTSDMQGGINAGIDTCWYNPLRKPNTTSVKPKYEIHHLSELRTIVGLG
ncbi:noncanonical pyrimidine nucleotidase, YjjG family [Paenibacillus sp. 1011MAR3C5]|uniref:YjjG family noncanonical pyrimidine nucleotidase n=1 Tax=Paenibacillus sp. 1011MAR3C5 TaxID=1675787 RepID=UPI000E6BAC45|nr:YjjG family noncanonical pyrimidine nucleotidase [Paenibacillus sp. 1011MAR3C5]RJE87490.1 noncanonical pyrimidine nucleotidase, YjjG family [Paenibacillus sp. 1011MAR3C5]